MHSSRRMRLMCWPSTVSTPMRQHVGSGRRQPSCKRATAALVQASDVVVFMESEHRRFCENWIEPARQRVEVWEIEDLGSVDAAEIVNEVERTFGIIRQRTETLLTTLGLSDLTAT